MELADRRRVLASTAALLAMPFFFVCGLCHFCMGGHMQHPPYPWYYVANEFGWLSFLVIASVFAFRSSIPARKTFIALAVLMLTLRFLWEGCLTLLMAVALVVVSIQGLRGNETTTRRSNRTPEATLETAPIATPEAPQG
jgi:membrane protein implicated in regulation of membrane protease activity